MRLACTLSILMFTACGAVDADGDGYDIEVDCDDNDGEIHPDANERCDGVDQDCDGQIDEAAIDAQAVYLDEDLDGIGAGSARFRCAAAEPGWSTERGDCDDSDAAVFPGATETCDQRDQDCDGEVDEGDVCGETQCDDGLDDDADGLIDCDDPDCDGACPEVCEDGRDNDGDTNTDCADPDCWDAASCVEVDCDDGMDNEADGLTDCDDPDCWTADCPDVLYRVTGGTLSVSRETLVWTEKNCDPPDCETGVDRTQEVQAYDIRGELRRKLDGEWTTCDWAYDRGRFAEQIESGVRVGSTVERAGFTLEPGCEVHDDRFLPRRFILVEDAVHLVDGRPWFTGDRFENNLRLSDLEDPDRSGKVTRDLAFWDPLRPPEQPLGSCAVGAPVTGFADGDLDGLGQTGDGIATCVLGPLEELAEDCADDDDSRPAASETCGNGLDDDCDGIAPTCDGPGGISDTTEAVGDRLVIGDLPRLFAIGDVDADGRSDLAWGLPNADTDTGAVMVDLAGGTQVWSGVTAGDVAGAFVIHAGDHTGDGRPELLIGATGVIRDGVVRSGAVYLIDPGLGGGSLSDATATIRGDGQWLGASAALIDDRDGIPLLAVGAQTDATGGTNAGAVLLFEGPITADLDTGDADVILTGSRNDIVGDAIAGPGDVDGDGLADLLVGHRKADGDEPEAGAGRLLLAPFTSGPLADADATWTGHLVDAWAGERVAAAGDINDDGYADLLVSAPRTYGVAPRFMAATGEVYLLHGSASPTGGTLRDADAVIRGDRIYDLAGADLAGARDVDLDGVDDFAIGAPGDDRGGPNAGSIAVFTRDVRGSVRLADADGTYRGDPGTQLGTWVVLQDGIWGVGIDNSADGRLLAWPVGEGW